MPVPLLQQHVNVRQGAYLPHWTLTGAIYHVVFRLADSLPVAIVARLRSEREILLNTPSQVGIRPVGLTVDQQMLFSERIEAILDNGLGACWLGRDDVAGLAETALQSFNGARYALYAWCVMPNHIHAVVQPLDGHELPAILKTWKGYIAREANRLLSRSGEFWQPEYYDHLIRSEAELAQTIRYVQANPSQAGLANWRWVWPTWQGSPDP